MHTFALFAGPKKERIHRGAAIVTAVALSTCNVQTSNFFEPMALVTIPLTGLATSELAAAFLPHPSQGSHEESISVANF
jgi:hypothetical protein